MELGQFLALTLSGLLVTLAGIAVTGYLTHRQNRRRLDQALAEQTKAIQALTDQQTKALARLTEVQTEILLGRRWPWRSTRRGPS